MTEPRSLCPDDFQLIESIVLGVSTAGGGNFLVLLVFILEFLHQKLPDLDPKSAFRSDLKFGIAAGVFLEIDMI